MMESGFRLQKSVVCSLTPSMFLSNAEKCVMKAMGIIPARLQSSRLPRKLLLDETGKPLIQYVWEAAGRTESLSDVIVATDSSEIAETVQAFGGRCKMTGTHPSGTDRIAEVVRCGLPEHEIIVNIQGDEPEIDPNQINLLVKTLSDHPSVQMATLATPITTDEERDDPSCTKVVCAEDGRALYFSRSPIPFVRDAPKRFLKSADDKANSSNGMSPGHSSPWLLHLGIYAYRFDFLLELTERPPSRLEQLEKLEQLRALEAGAIIQVVIVEHRSVGIDTPEDYARFVERQRTRVL
jgi:3-deoxy-manno-octulosonate cytidylyltransferase (CMP-KDO synthetase)